MRDIRPEVYTTSGSGCFAMAQTHRHTDGHGDSMTNSAQWGRVGENTAIGVTAVGVTAVRNDLKL